MRFRMWNGFIAVLCVLSWGILPQIINKDVAFLIMIPITFAIGYFLVYAVMGDPNEVKDDNR